MSKIVRCAIYTRKSTDEGLDQAFNTLDAQREACEAYIVSQKGEGWRTLPKHYDDGGFSGGNLDRPAMQRLLADVDNGEVDVIVVYKVDRLTRSLMDFSRIVDRLDARNVSFVSVTQAFNTTTSMGRLTLNVLLSFAQFEREVTGERIRDKIAASKAKGMWMGGNVPLGYDLGERELVVNELEAGQVRHIFRRYRDLGSAIPLMKELGQAGIVSKRWTSRSGNLKGGQPFSCGALYYMLQNRLYRGEIVHRDRCHAGAHEAIVDEELFGAVQGLLATNRRERREVRTRSTRCLLVGKIYDVDGEAMATSFSYGRGGRLYRYYVSGSLDPSERKVKPGRRVPATGIETAIFDALGQISDRRGPDELLPLIQRVQLNSEAIHCLVDPTALQEPLESLDHCTDRLGRELSGAELRPVGSSLLLTITRAPRFRGGASQRAGGPQLVREGVTRDQVKKAHQLLGLHCMSPLAPERHRAAVAPAGQRQRRLMMLGLLAPQLQKRLMVAGGAEALADPGNLPLAWADQLAISSV